MIISLKDSIPTIISEDSERVQANAELYYYRCTTSLDGVNKNHYWEYNPLTENIEQIIEGLIIIEH